jgi:hypothetical protein
MYPMLRDPAYWQPSPSFGVPQRSMARLESGSAESDNGKVKGLITSWKARLDDVSS